MMHKKPTSPDLPTVTTNIVKAVYENKTEEVKKLCNALEKAAISFACRHSSSQSNPSNPTLELINTEIRNLVEVALYKDILCEGLGTRPSKKGFFQRIKNFFHTYSIANAISNGDVARINSILSTLEKYILIFNNKSKLKQDEEYFNKLRDEFLKSDIFKKYKNIFPEERKDAQNPPEDKGPQEFKDSPFFFMKNSVLLMSDYLQKPIIIGEDNISWNPIFYTLDSLFFKKKFELIEVLSQFFKIIHLDAQFERSLEEHGESKTEAIVVPKAVKEALCQHFDKQTYTTPLTYLFMSLEYLKYFKKDSQQHKEDIMRLIFQVTRIYPNILVVNASVIVRIILRERLDDLDYYLRLMVHFKITFTEEQLNDIENAFKKLIKQKKDASQADRLFDDFLGISFLAPRKEAFTEKIPAESQTKAISPLQRYSAIGRLPSTPVEPFTIDQQESPKNQKRA